MPGRSLPKTITNVLVQDPEKLARLIKICFIINKYKNK